MVCKAYVHPSSPGRAPKPVCSQPDGSLQTPVRICTRALSQCMECGISQDCGVWTNQDRAWRMPCVERTSSPRRACCICLARAPPPSTAHGAARQLSWVFHDPGVVPNSHSLRPLHLSPMSARTSSYIELLGFCTGKG